MKNFAFFGMAALGLLMSSGAQAESWTMETEFGAATWIGGVGPDRAIGRAGTSSTTTHVNFQGEEFDVSGTCAFMDQPPNGMFDFHMTCHDEGATSIWGCNPLPGRENEYRCVGAIEGLSGEIQGRQGIVASHLHSISENGARGTGIGMWVE